MKAFSEIRMTSNEMFEHAKTTSQRILAKQGSLTPMVLAPEAIVPLPMSREEMQVALRYFAANFDWFVLVQEVWLAAYEKSDQRAPSERPDRAEAIMVMLVEGGVHRRISQCRFHRTPEGTFLFEDWTTNNTAAYQTTQSGVCQGIKNPS
jgi:hypothetical protein